MTRGALIAVLAIAADLHPALAQPPSGNLLEELRPGGYVIFLRHAATDRSVPDAERVNLEDCSTQRPLSDAGRDQARQIGRAMATRGIPVKTVLSSPYCRCLETARLAFGKAESASFLHFAVDADADTRSRISTELRRRLGTPPAPGTNTVLVAHTANLREATGVWPKTEGVMHVFRPTSTGGYVHVGQIDPAEWTRVLATRSPGAR